MTPISPRPFGGQLLRRLVPAQDHDALLGDLCEEYQRRRSLSWHWLQILAAIVVGSWKDTRAHCFLALRAIAVGVLGGTWIGLPWYWHSPYLSWSFWATLRVLSIAAGVAQGWILVRLHRQHGITMLLAFRGVEASTRRRLARNASGGSA